MQNQANNAEANKSFNPSDEQIDKFFESGGSQSALKEETANETKEEEVVDEKPVEQEIEEKPIEAKVNPEVAKREEQERNVHKALHEERERRREMQRKIEEIEGHKQKMEQRFQEFIEKARGPVDNPPSFDEDPLEHLRYKSNQLEKTQKQFQEIEQRRREYEQNQAEINKTVNKYKADAANYLKENPDFNDAYQYLIKHEFNRLRAKGYETDEAYNEINEMEFKDVMLAYKKGMNPAEKIYELAKASGYRKVEAPSKAESIDENKFKTIEKGIKNSKSLSNGGSSRIDKGLTLQALMEMDDDEFRDVPDHVWQKLMKQGG